MVDNLAIKINLRAGKVNQQFKEELKRSLDDTVETTFYKDHEREKIVTKNPDVIVLGGGDGTVSYEANRYIELLKNPKEFNRLKFAILKMGTGNGLSSETGTTNNHHQHLEQILSADNLPTVEIPLIEVQHTNGITPTEISYCPFTGAGWDAIMLSWYNRLKKGGIKGLRGYLGAVGPAATEVLCGEKPDFKVNFPQGARIGYGNKKRLRFFECPPGNDLLFSRESEIHSLVAGTAQYYGFEFVAFPYAESARERGEMHLRAVCGNRYLTILELIGNALPVWQGKHRSNNVLEIMAKEVNLDISNGGIKTQMSGESLGKFNRINWKVSDYKLNLVDYRAMGV